MCLSFAFGTLYEDLLRHSCLILALAIFFPHAKSNEFAAVPCDALSRFPTKAFLGLLPSQGKYSFRKRRSWALIGRIAGGDGRDYQVKTRKDEKE